MKTNIVKLAEGIYGKRIGDALYAVSGNEYEGYDLDVADIYRTIEGELVAYDGFMVFPAMETNWANRRYNPPIARGKAAKKRRREERIEQMCGVWWHPQTKLKKLGKQRRLRRRMWPSEVEWRMYFDELPF